MAPSWPFELRQFIGSSGIPMAYLLPSKLFRRKRTKSYNRVCNECHSKSLAQFSQLEFMPRTSLGTFGNH